MDLGIFYKWLRAVVLITTLSFLLLGAFLPPGVEEQEKEKECCFVHPNYIGVCSVVPSEDENCEEILLYLNTPATVGKTYCDGTRIRGGWERIDCPPEQ